LFNAPLFSARGTVVMAFGLHPEHEGKEDNLVAVCAATGLKLLRLPVLRASFVGDYSLARPVRPSTAEVSAAGASGSSSSHQRPGRVPGVPPTAEEVAQSIVSKMLYGF
jgi:hypothetical protein